MVRVSGAAVDYRFFRVSAGDVDLVVDVIRVRGEAEIEVRASYWHGRGRGVARSRVAPGGPADLPRSEDVGHEVRVAGSAGDVRWDLLIRPGALVVDPRGGVLRHLRAFDVQIVSRPDARFSGWVEVAGKRTIVESAGLLSYYWGRRLPSSWYWVSANADGVIVDAVLGVSRLWGLPWPRLRVGYVFIESGGKRVFHVRPLNSVVTAEGDPYAFRIKAWRPGARLTLECHGDPATYNDLGLGIMQTLRGTCRVGGPATLSMTAGLEARDTRS